MALLFQALYYSIFLPQYCTAKESPDVFSHAAVYVEGVNCRLKAFSDIS